MLFQRRSFAMVFTRTVSIATRRQNDPYTTPPTNPVQLLQHIHVARSLDNLHTKLKKHRRKVQALHCAAALYRLAAIVNVTLKRTGAQYLPEKEQALATALLEQITQLATPLLTQYSIREVSNSIWALGQLVDVLPSGEGVRPLQHALIKELSAKGYEKLFAGSDSMDAAQLISGAASLRVKDRQLWGALGRLCVRRCAEPSDMTARQVAAIAATLVHSQGANVSAVFAALASRGQQVAEWFRPWNAAPTIFAFAAGGQAAAHAPFMQSLVQALLNQLPTSHSAADIAHAAGALGKLHSSLQQEQAPSGITASADAGQGAAPAAAAAAAAAAPQAGPEVQKLQGMAVEAGRVVAGKLDKHMESYNASELSMLLLGLAQLGCAEGGLLEAVAGGIAGEERIAAGASSRVRILRAFAMSGHRSEAVKGMVRRLCEFPLIVKRQRVRKVVSILESLRVLDCEEGGLVQGVVEAVGGWEVEKVGGLLWHLRHRGYQGAAYSDLVALLAKQGGEIDWADARGADCVAVAEVTRHLKGSSDPELVRGLARRALELGAKGALVPLEGEVAEKFDCVREGQECPAAAVALYALSAAGMAEDELMQEAVRKMQEQVGGWGSTWVVRCVSCVPEVQDEMWEGAWGVLMGEVRRRLEGMEEQDLAHLARGLMRLQEGEVLGQVREQAESRQLVGVLRVLDAGH